MSERRPHWDDELIEAVWDVAYATSDGCCLSAEGTHAVIAAVEDWHKAKRDSRIRTHSEGCWRWHNECAEWLIESQMAAMKRVRDVCMSSHVDEKGKRVVFLDRIQRALDGDGDA